MEKKNICRTALGIAIQASKLLKRPYSYARYTTLNEYYDINANAHLDLAESPDVKYFSIGRGGHRAHVDDTNTPVMDPISHEATHTGPYQGVPLVLRQLNDDLNAEYRARYALRRKETHNGVEYWAYYLKRLPEVNIPPEVIHDNTKDDITTSKVFVYTNDDLHPTPADLPAEGVVVTSSDIIRISSRVEISLTAFDVAEFYKVNKILFGSEQRSILSEILICAGVDKDVKIETSDSASVNFKEAVGVQVVTFVSTFVNLIDFNQGFRLAFELGAGEPLLTSGALNATRYSPGTVPSAVAATLAGTAYDASNRENGNGVSTTRDIKAQPNTQPAAPVTPPKKPGTTSTVGP